MTTTVDVIIVGTGSAAQTVAYSCRAASWSVAVVDSRPFGGTCQNRGCDPKKVLVGVSELVDWSWRMQGKGISTPGLSIICQDLMRFKCTFTDRILGAHLLGLNAEEVINIFALAMRTGLHASDLKSMLYAYPTSASDVSYML